MLIKIPQVLVTVRHMGGLTGKKGKKLTPQSCIVELNTGGVSIQEKKNIHMYI